MDHQHMQKNCDKIKAPRMVILHGLHVNTAYDFQPAGVPLRESWGHIADMLDMGFVAIRIGHRLHLMPGDCQEGRA
ncbi:hypothetical protein [uncultured Paracoccus sp.]|uniref:hypothetical protein n=1 Tax=uncultured Paracoccus sp. TaxID=189685 RepID=UPI0026336967|nr:hypothetical protein [uncultured Paracoccus sp.]